MCEAQNLIKPKLTIYKLLTEYILYITYQVYKD